MSFRIDTWDPGYGTSGDADLATSAAEIVADLEVPADQWGPVTPQQVDGPGAILFTDGVRRLDARVWFDPEPGRQLPEPGVCASLGAAVVCCCPAGAHVTDVRVERLAVAVRADVPDLVTTAGTYTGHPLDRAPGVELSTALSRGVQARLAALEVDVVRGLRRPGTGAHTAPDDLIVVDGPLRTHSAVPRAVGFIKAHHATYLPDRLNAVVAALQPGQRTPVFALGTQWHRFSWYLRLPGDATGWWAGVVRLEASAELDLDAVQLIADQSARVLPRFASVEYKDTRAPQNLYPTGALERYLRRRLGDPALLHRALRRAAA